jgi:L-seryl-tRNA(Ser) seleniumtransferase
MELKALGNRYGLPLVYDIGSGAFLDTADYGLEHEPMIQEALSDGADLVCFSGDKLLGGPQAGIILGKREYISRIKKHPLLRVIRIDKISAIALEITLMHYLKKEATDKIPVWQMLSAGINELGARAAEIVKTLAASGIKAEIGDGKSMVGGGSLPDQTLPSITVAIRPPQCSLEDFALKLRLSEPSVIGRIDDGKFLIDIRTVLPSFDDTLIEVIKKALV